MGDVESISQDTVMGIAAMAAFTGMKERKVHYLASGGQLPGAFRLGTSWGLLKSVYAAELRSRAMGVHAMAKGA